MVFGVANAEINEALPRDQIILLRGSQITLAQPPHGPSTSIVAPLHLLPSAQFIKPEKYRLRSNSSSSIHLRTILAPFWFVSKKLSRCRQISGRFEVRRFMLILLLLSGHTLYFSNIEYQ